MTKSSGFFRWVWRLDALLILIATGAIAFGVGSLLVGEVGARIDRQQSAATAPVVAADQSDDLVLGGASFVVGTPILRAELTANRGGAKFSSGSYGETRNLLFIEPGEKTARWLLPDHDHLIADNRDVTRQEGEPATTRTVATVVLVTARGAQATGGRLLLLDPSARRIQQIADGVRRLHAATVSGPDLIVVYERDRRLWLAAFDPGSLEKRNDQQLEVPLLK